MKILKIYPLLYEKRMEIKNAFKNSQTQNKGKSMSFFKNKSKIE
jgi:hypothetical protein